MKRRSVLVLSDESRNRWEHSIVPRPSDVQDGQKIAGKVRVSLTFRTIKEND